MADALLTIEGLTKRFGGVIASDNVGLAVRKGELHAIIGPNGAGKTTLIGQLCAEIGPDAGPPHFAGRDLTAPHAPPRGGPDRGRPTRARRTRRGPGGRARGGGPHGG